MVLCIIQLCGTLRGSPRDNKTFWWQPKKLCRQKEIPWRQKKAPETPQNCGNKKNSGDQQEIRRQTQVLEKTKFLQTKENPCRPKKSSGDKQNVLETPPKKALETQKQFWS